MPRIPWNPRNYSYGHGSNFGPVALAAYANGETYIGQDGRMHLTEKGRRKKCSQKQETTNGISE